MRIAIVVLLVLTAAWAALGFLEIVPLPFGLGARDASESAAGSTLGAGETADDAAARLEGRARAKAGEVAAPTLVAPPVPAEVRGSVPHGALLRGRVVARGDAPVPIAGAAVQLVRPHAVTAFLKTPAEGRWDVLEARTGADGRFAFVDVRPARGYVVRARSGAGASTSTERFAVVERQVKDLGDLALGAAGSLEGRVTDGEGRPIANAQVAVSWKVESFLGIILPDPDLLPEVEARTATDADGRYRLAPLERGAKTLVVASAANGGSVTIPTVGEGVTTHDVSLSATGVIGGRVSWEDDKPAAGVRVFAVEALLIDGSVHSGVSAADGTFRIEHIAGEDLRLSAFVPGLPVRPTGPIAPGTLDVVLRLPLTGGLTGRVTRKVDGKPVERFGILLEPQGAEDGTARALRRMLATAVGAQGFIARDGSFSVPLLAEGTYVVVVQAAGFPESRSQPVKVPAAGVGDAGTIALVDGHGAAGVVRTAAGEPVARAEVRLRAAVAGPSGTTEDEEERIQGDDLASAPDAVTDDEGRFTLPPQTPATYEVHVTHPFARPHVEKDVDLKHGPRLDLDLRLTPAGTVRATLVESDGKPAAREGAWLMRPDGYTTWGRTDDEGRCLFESVPLGPCLVRWQSAISYAEARVMKDAPDDGARTRAWEALRGDTPETIVRAAEESAVRVSLGSRVELTLKIAPWADDVKSVSDAWVELTSKGTWFRAPRQEDGSFRGRVPPGTYQVYAIPAPQGWEGSKAFSGIVVPEGRTHTVELTR